MVQVRLEKEGEGGGGFGVVGSLGSAESKGDQASLTGACVNIYWKRRDVLVFWLLLT